MRHDMPWTLDHLPAREEWSKTFPTKAKAVAELRKHICGSCMAGCWGCPDPAKCDSDCEKANPPDPSSARDLLKTPCGCEYELFENPRKTHCKFGHKYTPENTIWKKDGSRRCRECTRAADRARDAIRRPRKSSQVAAALEDIAKEAERYADRMEREVGAIKQRRRVPEPQLSKLKAQHWRIIAKFMREQANKSLTRNQKYRALEMTMAEMTRDEISAFFGEAARVEFALNALPYRDAVPAMRALQDMRDLVGEQLPGGYYGKCIGCEEVKGEDEMVNCGDENLCTECAKAAAA